MSQSTLLVATLVSMLEARLDASKLAGLPCPKKAGIVLLCKWLCPSLLESFNSQDDTRWETTKAGFLFGSRSRALAACLRRMAQARLLRVPPSDTGTQRFESGAFALPKDHRDRFIGDRRRQNEKERLYVDGPCSSRHGSQLPTELLSRINCA